MCPTRTQCKRAQCKPYSTGSRERVQILVKHRLKSNALLSVTTVTLYVTCSAILGLLDKDDDPKASHELLITERVLQISQIGAEILLFECERVGQPKYNKK